MITAAETLTKNPADIAALLSVMDVSDGDANIFTTVCVDGDAKRAMRITGTHPVVLNHSSAKSVSTLVAPLWRRLKMIRIKDDIA